MIPASVGVDQSRDCANRVWTYRSWMPLKEFTPWQPKQSYGPQWHLDLFMKGTSKRHRHSFMSIAALNMTTKSRP